MRILLAVTTMLITALPAQAVVLTNGSFEMGVFTGAPFETLAAGDTNITGWSIGGEGVDWIGSFWQASDGGRSLDLSALGAGSIAQTLTTVANNTYRVTFDLSGNPIGAPPVKDVEVSINGVDGSFYGYSTGANSASNMNWLTYTYEFVATSTSSILAFTSQSDSASGPALDNVRIEDLGTTVPEPATWASMILGLGFVGAVARRRRSALAI